VFDFFSKIVPFMRLFGKIQ